MSVLYQARENFILLDCLMLNIMLWPCYLPFHYIFGWSLFLLDSFIDFPGTCTGFTNTFECTGFVPSLLVPSNIGKITTYRGNYNILPTGPSVLKNYTNLH